MDKNSVKKLFNSFSKKKVMIIGDVMIDSYMWGSVDRISPEAPIPIVAITHKENRLGGAANVGLNLLSLGAQPILCSVIGNDNMGIEFLDLLQKSKLSSAGIIKSEQRITTVKTRVISNNQHLLRVDEEITSRLPEEAEQELILRINEIIEDEKIDAIIFQDYDKGNITPVIIEEIIYKANSLDIPILVDPKKRNFNHFKNATFFKPNFKELVEGLLVDMKKQDTHAIFKATTLLHKTMNLQYVMVTLSEVGIFISHNKKYHSLPAEIRDIADVSGAGDTVIAVACLCLTGGIGAEDIAAISNIAGGLVCEKAGVVPIERDILFEECLDAYS
ncbi:MAG: bifunctional ADP-heptose synthase [Bacteroidota bacterium]|nr:bifunctional ADP-heptose synthase [Bacteroidota bacterium]